MSCTDCRGGKNRVIRQPVTKITPVRVPDPARPVLGSYEQSRTRIRGRIMGMRNETPKGNK
jgi:hypothetical protein